MLQNSCPGHLGGRTGTGGDGRGENSLAEDGGRKGIAGRLTGKGMRGKHDSAWEKIGGLARGRMEKGMTED